MSVFRLISAIAVSNALWRKFAQTCKGASWMIFPPSSFTDSSPRTFRSCSKVMRFYPTETCFFAQLYSRRAYWLRSPTIGWLLIAAASSNMCLVDFDVFKPQKDTRNRRIDQHTWECCCRVASRFHHRCGRIYGTKAVASEPICGEVGGWPVKILIRPLSFT
jgi:hypothetical protein